MTGEPCDFTCHSVVADMARDHTCGTTLSPSRAVTRCWLLGLVDDSAAAQMRMNAAPAIAAPPRVNPTRSVYRGEFVPASQALVASFFGH